jgi:hypothetical protein
MHLEFWSRVAREFSFEFHEENFEDATPWEDLSLDERRPYDFLGDKLLDIYYNSMSQKMPMLSDMELAKRELLDCVRF